MSNVTKRQARNIVDLLQHGLVRGVGEPKPGKMCVEAAVCYALGEPHGDNPSCVGEAVRAFKIRLNDTKWHSNKARADGMREIAIAQLGSNEIDQVEFAQRIALKTVQQILPIALRAAAKDVPAHAEVLEAAADACEVSVDLAQAKLAAWVARNAAYAYANATVAAATAAYGATYSAAAAATAVDDATAASAAEDAAAAAAYTSVYVDAPKQRLCILKKAAALGVDVLVEMGCKGTRWLELAK